MRIHDQATDAYLYDLFVNGQKQTDWVWADDTTGDYELFVTDVAWRGGGKIADTDNSTGFQTLKQTGKVEFKRNDLPAPSSGYGERADQADEAAWNNMWGGFPGYCSPLQEQRDQLAPATQEFISERLAANGCLEPVFPLPSFQEFQRSVTFTSEDGEVWDFADQTGHRGQVRFLDTRVTGDWLEMHVEPLHREPAPGGWDAVPDPEPMRATWRVVSPGLSWTYEYHQPVCRRAFTLTPYCEDYKARGMQLFQWLDYLGIWIRQEVGLLV